MDVGVCVCMKLEKKKDHHRERSHPGKKKGNKIYVKDYRREVIEQGGKGRGRLGGGDRDKDQK